MTTTMPEPEWVGWSVGGPPPTVVDVCDGAPSVLLAPTLRGAILLWQFDQGEDDSRYLLMAHLTDAEAQAIFAAPWTVGLLEPVRPTLFDNRAVIARRRNGCEEDRHILIPRTGSEETFVELIRGIAEELSQVELPHPHHAKRRNRREDHTLSERLLASVR